MEKICVGPPTSEPKPELEAPESGLVYKQPEVPKSGSVYKQPEAPKSGSVYILYNRRHQKTESVYIYIRPEAPKLGSVYNQRHQNQGQCTYNDH